MLWSYVLKPLGRFYLFLLAVAVVIAAAEFATRNALLLISALAVSAFVLTKIWLKHRERRLQLQLAGLKKKEQKPGHVYLLASPDLPDCVKIGMTTKSPELRARQVTRDYQNDGLIERPFKLVKAVPTTSPAALEKAMHGTFSELNIDKTRLAGKQELFVVPMKRAIRILDTLVAAKRDTYWLESLRNEVEDLAADAKKVVTIVLANLPSRSAPHLAHPSKIDESEGLAPELLEPPTTGSR